MSEHTRIIEINGVKLEVDLRTAKRVDELKIGSRVKCLIKEYSAHTVCPGVIVGFDPFRELPTIQVAYFKEEYGSGVIHFKAVNEKTEDFEIVADLDMTPLQIDKANILNKFQREIEKKELEITELQQKREYFLAKFGEYFK